MSKLFYHVERMYQSGSDRDISYYFLINSEGFLDFARNDKEGESV